MPLDSTILEAVRSTAAREANWLNMRVALQRVARVARPMCTTVSGTNRRKRTSLMPARRPYA